MRRVLVIISLMLIFAGCTPATPSSPTATNTPRPTVTPLGQANTNAVAAPIVVVTREVEVTRLVPITFTPQSASTNTPISKPTPAPPLAPTAIRTELAVTPAPLTLEVIGTAAPAYPVVTQRAEDAQLIPPTAISQPLSPTPPVPTPSPVPSPTATPDYTGLWATIGSMTISRGWHSATVLQDGRVLIVGGYTSLDRDTATAEIFDPTTNTFSPTGSLNTARHDHSATLLPDGRVLIIAGYALGWLRSAEIYDPGTGQWTVTQPIFAHGVAHTATLLKDGRVLVMGGATQGGYSAPNDRVEIFDPKTNLWQSAAPHTQTDSSHTATLLTDGRVLIAGGLADPAVYDPVTDSWQSAGKLATERCFAQAARLQDGRVLLIGGYFCRENTPTNSVEVYDPDTNAWQQAAPLAQARYLHTVIALPDGRVLVVGGWKSYNGYEAALLNTVEVYDPKKGTWGPLAALNSGRVEHTTTLLPDGRILVTGGETTRGTFLNSAEVLGP